MRLQTWFTGQQRVVSATDRESALRGSEPCADAASCVLRASGPLRRDCEEGACGVLPSPRDTLRCAPLSCVRESACALGLFFFVLFWQGSVGSQQTEGGGGGGGGSLRVPTHNKR